MSVKELKEIYENGFILEFDDNDKIVFISDVHRGDGTYSDSLLPNRNIYITALKYYLEKNYIYIELCFASLLFFQMPHCGGDKVFDLIARIAADRCIECAVHRLRPLGFNRTGTAEHTDNGTDCRTVAVRIKADLNRHTNGP